MFKRILILASLVICIWTTQAFCGASGEPESYLEQVAAIDPNTTDKKQELANNLEGLFFNAVRYTDMGYEYFASPGAINKINLETKKSILKDKVYEILPKYLESNDPEIRENATWALALYGWPKSYEYMEKTNGIPTEKAIIFAVLGDKRAIPWIIEQYQREDANYKTKPVFSYPAKMTYLNCLYHLASPESITFLKEVISNPKPENIKPRAERVLKRIYKLFPELKK